MYRAPMGASAGRRRWENLKIDKVVCFDTVLQLFILKELASSSF